LSGEIVGIGEITSVKLDSGGTVISAAPTHASDKGLKVNVGIRPEDMIITDEDVYAFEGKVKFTEALGEVTLLHFEPVAGKDGLIGKLAGIHANLRRTTVRMTAASEKVQIFHEGRSLYYR